MFHRANWTASVCRGLIIDIVFVVFDVLPDDGKCSSMFASMVKVYTILRKLRFQRQDLLALNRETDIFWRYVVQMLLW